MPDIRLVQNRLFPGQGVVQTDWLLRSNGTLDDTQALATAIIVALGTDRLADSSDTLPDPDDTNRRGWWGDYQAQDIWDGWPIGSRLWLLQRSKITGPEAREGATTVLVTQYIRECIQPFIDRRIGSSFTVEATRVGKEQIDALIRIYRGPIVEIELRYAILWDETTPQATPPAPWAPLAPMTNRGRGSARGTGSAVADGDMIIDAGVAKGAAASAGSTASGVGTKKLTSIGMAPAGIIGVAAVGNWKIAVPGAAAGHGSAAAVPTVFGGVGAASGIGVLNGYSAVATSYTDIYNVQNVAGWQDFAGYRGSYRQVVQLIGDSQGKIRILVEQFCDAAAGHFSDTTHVSFGKWAGTNADTTTTPVELKFGGVSGFTGPRSGAQFQTLLSDTVAHPGFTLATGDSIVVIFDTPTSDATAHLGGEAWGEGASSFWWWNNSPLETWNIAAPGVTAGGTSSQVVALSKVQTAPAGPTASIAVGAASGSGTAHGVGPPATITGTGAASATGAASGVYATATLIWADEFTAPLNLASDSNPNGTWRPNAIWQDINQGYQDFAGTNWDISPNDPAWAAYPPYSQSGSVLTLYSFRMPSDMVAHTRAQMDAQGNSNPVPAWCGCQLSTNSVVRKFKQPYYVEWKARWPIDGQGMFPALWMFSSDFSLDPQNKGSAEIDMLEINGHGGWFNTNLHQRNTDHSGYDSAGYGPFTGDTQGWHTYGVDRTSTYIRFYRDNVLLYEATGTDASWFNDVNMDILINFAMDAYWFYSYGLNSDTTTPSPMTMEVDYVRVYSSKP
jgi:phage gp46-like protein